MNTTITSKGLPALPQPQNGQTSTGTAGAGQTTGSEATAAPVVSGDRVQLTESARALQAARGGGSSSFDAKRVEQIRQSLADGSYRVNASKIADGLISLEGKIDGKA
ncbi:flagellar biosynthesis anti-sigma factor FlgM [Dyella subtropica]|uniref:flagellar biosynthesis anti-sigma factor FlgM n=1 Tax=Dyella subtropica TaxID=2992127 RepID=UPI002255AC84|nr:flagellar biosynthesis anti-sigma factor FlgM [Dyella subtropica]